MGLNDSGESELWSIPPPTGITRTWWIDPEHAETIFHLLEAMEEARRKRRVEEYTSLREQLLGMPGHPHVDPGDVIELRSRPRLISAPGVVLRPKGN